MKLKPKKIIITLMFTALYLTALGGMTGNAFAETSDSKTSTGRKEYTPLAPLPGTTNSEGKVTIDSYIPGVFNLAIGIAGVLAVLMIIIGGVEYITTDAIQGKSDGKARIQNALGGLVLVLVSYILLYTINPKLTVFDLNIKKSTVADTEGTENTGDYAGTGADAVFDVTFPSAETKECGLSSSGECYFKTTKYEEGDKKITQMMELPSFEGGTIQVHESYINEKGEIFYRRGTANTDGTITYTSEWKE